MTLIIFLLTALVGGTGGIVFFNEKLTLPFLMGSALIILGVFTATSFNYAKRHG